MSGELWNPERRLVALSQQVWVVFEVGKAEMVGHRPKKEKGKMESKI